MTWLQRYRLRHYAANSIWILPVLGMVGAMVAVNQLPEQDPAETMRRIGEAGGQGFPVVADMRDPGQVTAMVHAVAARGSGSAPAPLAEIGGAVDASADRIV